MPLPTSLEDLKLVSQSWKRTLSPFKNWRLVSPSWKEFVDTHVLWVAYQLAQFDVAASTWPNIIPSLDHELLMNDVWIR
jgi:hypothetical protein